MPQPKQTKLIGLKEFRQGISAYGEKAVRGNISYIVLKRNKPFLHVRPLTKKERIVAQLEADVTEARQAIKEGRTYSTEEVRNMLGIS